MPNGVVTASPGTYYTDTNGTNGAWRWIKKTGTGNTGWQVLEGDTGWRVCSAMLPATAKDSGFWLRRVGSTVYARFATPFSGTRPDAGVLIDWKLTPSLGSGFRPGEPTSTGTTATGSTSARYMSTVSALLQGRVDHFTGSNWVGQFGVTWDSGDSQQYARFGAKANTSSSWGGATINYPTVDPWPTTLPGTAA